MKEQTVTLHDLHHGPVIVGADKIAMRRRANEDVGDSPAAKTVILLDSGSSFAVIETMEEIASLIAAVPEN